MCGLGVQQSSSLSFCGHVYTANAGDAHVYGSELEIQAIVVRDLVVSLNGAYSHTRTLRS